MKKQKKLAKKIRLGNHVSLLPKCEPFMDNKVNTNRIAEKAGVPCVPYVLSPVKDYTTFTGSF